MNLVTYLSTIVIHLESFWFSNIVNNAAMILKYVLVYNLFMCFCEINI